MAEEITMKPVAVMLHVHDVGAAVDWYCTVFPSAQPVGDSNEQLAILDINGFGLEIVCEDSKVGSGKTGSVLYWSVPDLLDALVSFQAIGATLYRGPITIESGIGMCQLVDPFGNLIGLRGKLT